MTKLWSIILALLGILLHSIGILLQKKGTSNINFKEFINLKMLKNIKVSSDLIIWVTGLLLAYNISIFPTAIASKELSPQVVSAISGLGIVIIIILSHFFLKEELYKTDIVFAVIIIVCISVICITQQKEFITYIDSTAFYVLTFSPFLLLIPAFSNRLMNKIKAVLYASISGLTGGIAYIILNIAVKKCGDSFIGLFSSAYIYEYIIIGFISGVFLQVSYKFGDIIHIVPIQMSLTVIYPLICSYFIFHKSISLVQDLSILVIALCCWIILSRH
jgi:drug/metabolite transporter (DMT)-like permease